ncbi:MAG: Rrf2 family transcriptional regulator [Clostridiales bacterium]|jgi:Rrf2 family protein|nr:Rrf2 family transcriptional regulator [Clostridiales bacterium]
MKISTRGRYGLRALIDIAAQEIGSCVPLCSIAQRQGLSEAYLEQLMSQLKKAGVVKSVRGAQGGYILNRAPEEISVGEILRVLEGPMYPVDCLSDTEKPSCGAASCSTCVTKPLWEKLYSSVNDVLESCSLKDLANAYLEI